MDLRGNNRGFISWLSEASPMSCRSVNVEAVGFNPFWPLPSADQSTASCAG